MKPRKKPMKTPHKHAALIKAWADGAEIEYKSPNHGVWLIANDPGWLTDLVYRIKPKSKPDYTNCFYSDARGVRRLEHWELANLKLTFDGESGSLKAAEVL